MIAACYTLIAGGLFMIFMVIAAREGERQKRLDEQSKDPDSPKGIEQTSPH